MTYFTLFLNLRDRIVFHPSLFIYIHTCIIFMFYKSCDTNIVYWGLSKLHMCGDSILANNSLANLDFPGPGIYF